MCRRVRWLSARRGSRRCGPGAWGAPDRPPALCRSTRPRHLPGVGHGCVRRRGEPLRPPSSCHMRSVRRRHAARTCSPVALSNRAWISTEPSPWVLCQPARRARCFAWRSSVSVADVCLPTNSRALRANRSAGIASAVFTNASATSGVTCSAASATIAACSTLSRPSANDSASAGISARPRAVTMSFLA